MIKTIKQVMNELNLEAVNQSISKLNSYNKMSKRTSNKFRKLGLSVYPNRTLVLKQ